MKSVIDELYYEGLTLSQSLQRTREHKKRSADHMAAIDRFRQTLGRRQGKMLDAILEQSLDLTDLETKKYFHMGFCLGARFMLEVMQSEPLC